MYGKSGVCEVILDGICYKYSSHDEGITFFDNFANYPSIDLDDFKKGKYFQF